MKTPDFIRSATACSVLIAYIFTSSAYAVAITETWSQTLDGAGGWDSVYAMTTDISGNVYVTGRSQDLSNNTDYLTAKYSPDGSLAWTARYDSGGFDMALAIDVHEADGSVYVTGSEGDFYGTVKYDATGNQVWVRNSGTMMAQAKVILVDQSDGSVIVSGFDGGTVKYDQSGSVVWAITLNGSSMALDASSDVLIATNDGNAKLDGSTGDTQWLDSSRREAGNSSDGDIDIDQDNFIYFVGPSGIDGSGYGDIVTTKYDANGALIWNARYDSGDWDAPTGGVVVDNVGNTYVAGWSTALGAIVIKYDSVGNKVWEYNGNTEMRLADDVAIDANGAIYITGDVIGSIVTRKIDGATGELLWDGQYDGVADGTETASSITLGLNGEVFVAGESDNNFITLRYDAPVITLNGDNLTIEAGSSYTDAGAVADTVDGSVAITAVGSVNTSVPGDYTLTYDYTDTAGNAATQVTRTVMVVDTTTPVISLNGGNVTIEVGTIYSDAGAVASDIVDGAVAVSAAGTVNTSLPGTYTLTYDYTDMAGNAAIQVTRTVTVEDTTAPAIPLINTPVDGAASSATSVTISGTAEVNSAVDVYDNAILLGNTTANGNGDWSLDSGVLTEGAHSFTVTATDAAGNESTASVAVSYTVEAPANSGGGCALNRSGAGELDPLLPLLAMLSGIYLWRRRKQV